MDKTPISVNPQVTAAFVLDIFKKVGPRYIIVKKRGKLVGLITKKDVLVALQGKKEHNIKYSRVGENYAEDDLESVDGSEVSWKRRIRKWKVNSKASEASTHIELRDMNT